MVGSKTVDDSMAEVALGKAAMAVSYTHLDVYKRQPSGNTIGIYGNWGINVC